MTDDEDTPPLDLASLVHGETDIGSMPTEDLSPLSAVDDDPFPEAPKPNGRPLRDWSDKLKPRKGNASPKPTPTPKPIPPMPRGANAIIAPVEEFYTTLGMFLMPFDQPCGTAVVNSARQCAEAVDNVARNNPKVRAAILKWTEASVWGGLIAAHAGIMMTIAQHHGPASKIPSHVPPEWEQNGNG